MTNLVLNNELKGIEIYFNNKPIQSIIDSLKNNGYRWHSFKHCWYAKQSEKTMAEANKYIEIEIAPEQVLTATISTEVKIAKAVIKTAVTNNIKSLWNATRWIEGTANNSKQPVKDIASEIRKYVRSYFTNVKFSITSDHNSISFYIMSSPYDKESIYLKAIQEYCTNLLKSYNYCTCYDPYGDYGSTNNFYGAYAKIDYHYTQAEQTEITKTDMLDFDAEMLKFEIAEEVRKEATYQEHVKQNEEDHKNYLIRVEAEKKEIELINNSIEVINIEESKQYFVIGSDFANLNKNNTLNEYKEEVLKGDCYKQNVKITKEVHFQNEESFIYFSNMLLNDFDFLAQTGGSFTNDNRINSMTDYNNMTKEERETVIFNLYGVAIYYNNQLQFVVDAQGFSYARYVGLVDNAIIQKECITEQTITAKELTELKADADALTDISTNIITKHNILTTWNNESWTEYKELYKQELKRMNIKITNRIIQQIPEDMEQLKIAMYKLLIEFDGIQDQFKNADIQQGQKLTLFYISDFGSIASNKITFESVENTKYAQYDNNVKITYTPQGKRSMYTNNFHSTLLVYNGWLDLPETVLHDVENRNGMTITSTKYLSCDKKQYDEILNHFEIEGLKPIINTYKPTF